MYGCRPVERVLSGNLHPSPRTEISPIKLREEDHDLDHIAMLKQRIEVGDIDKLPLYSKFDYLGSFQAASQDRAKNGPGINKKHLFDLANKGGIQRHKSEPRRATNSSLSRRSRHSSNRPQQQQRRNQNLRNLVLENDEGLFRRFEARDIVPREGAAGIVRQNSLGERQAR